MEAVLKVLTLNSAYESVGQELNTKRLLADVVEWRFNRTKNRLGCGRGAGCVNVVDLRNRYEAAVKTLRAKNKRITQRAIAHEMGYHDAKALQQSLGSAGMRVNSKGILVLLPERAVKI